MSQRSFDVIVDAADLPAAIAALETSGYVHRGDLGVAGREAFLPLDEDPKRNVYVGEAGTLNARSHWRRGGYSVGGTTCATSTRPPRWL